MPQLFDPKAVPIYLKSRTTGTELIASASSIEDSEVDDETVDEQDELDADDSGVALADAADKTDEPKLELPTTPGKIRRTYFAPDQIASAGASYLKAIRDIAAANEGFTVRYNVPLENWPEDYGMMFAPKRIRSKTPGVKTVTGVIVLALPVIRLALQHKEGPAFIDRIWRAVCTAKALGAERSETSVAVPLSVQDFLQRRPRIGVNETFDDLVPDILKALRTRHFNISKAWLKRCLSSSDFATSQYPTIVQKTWVGIISALIAKGKAMNKDVAGMENWLATRDAKKYDAPDIAALAAMFA